MVTDKGRYWSMEQLKIVEKQFQTYFEFFMKGDKDLIVIGSWFQIVGASRQKADLSMLSLV